MCTFSRGEAGSCLLSHTESLQERWWPAHHAPPQNPLVSVAWHPLRGRSAISTIWSAGQLGFVSWASADEWIISSHLSLSKHTVSKGWIEEDIKYRRGCEGRRKYRHCAVMNIWKPSSGRNVLRGRKMYLCWLSSKIFYYFFFLGLMQVFRHYFKKNNILALWQCFLFVFLPLCLSHSLFNLLWLGPWCNCTSFHGAEWFPFRVWQELPVNVGCSSRWFSRSSAQWDLLLHKLPFKSLLF